MYEQKALAVVQKVRSAVTLQFRVLRELGKFLGDTGLLLCASVSMLECVSLLLFLSNILFAEWSIDLTYFQSYLFINLSLSHTIESHGVSRTPAHVPWAVEKKIARTSPTNQMFLKTLFSVETHIHWQIFRPVEMSG